MKRINLEYASGVDSIVFSLREKRFFSYKKDGEELHEKYGGYQYYCSNTGITGAGYLDFENGEIENDLIPFGYYRTDTTDTRDQKIKTVYDDGYCKIFGYVPINRYGGINRDYPAILTDGEMVVFLQLNQYESYDEIVLDTLINWEKIKETKRTKQIPLRYYEASWGEYNEVNFELYNPFEMKKVDALRFLDLRAARSEAYYDEDAIFNKSLFTRKTKIYWNGCYRKGGYYFHQNNHGYFDRRWEKNPTQITGHIVDDWHGNGKGLFWQRNGHKVFAFAEVPVKEVFPRYYIEGKLELIDYEISCPLIEWYEKPLEEWEKFFQSKLLRKVRKEFLYFKRQERSDKEFLNMLEQNKDFVLCFQDSLDSGNCKPGTEEFLEKYNIELDKNNSISIKGILENPHFEEFQKDYRFRRVIMHALQKRNEVAV